MDVRVYLAKCRKRVNSTLNHLLPSSRTKPAKLHQAMRYSTLSDGKRLRSSLVYATGEALGANKNILDHVSAAIEMIHAFSLIHDDLPSLDNDDLRRGKPACHKVFGEATAILAGDALQTLGFEIIANLNQKKLPAKIELKMIKILTHAIDSLGMAGGEELDIMMKNKKVTLKELENSYKLKTAYFLSASITLGALAAHYQNQRTLNKLKKFGEYLGIAFQIHDDIIGVESNSRTLGKPKNSDKLNNKPTYPSLIGLKKSKQKEQAAFRKAMYYLNSSGIAKKKLAAIAAYVIERNF